MKPKFVLSIEKAQRFALFLGLFNVSYDNGRRRFTERAVLSTYNRICRWIANTMALCLILAFLELVMGLKRYQNTAIIQDNLLWFINAVQLYLGVFFTYANHSWKRSHLLRMLNSVVRCNKNLVRLLGKDVDPPKLFYLWRNIRVVTMIVDAVITWNRPIVFYLITHEWKTMVVANKLVLLSSFLGQHQIQAFLGSSFHRMECFVRQRSTISLGEYRLLAEICLQLHKIRLSSNAYYGAFGLISYLSLIRTICFFYSSFSALFTSGIMRPDLVSTLINYFFWMMVPGLAGLIDIVLLGVAADAVDKSVKRFYFTVYWIEYKSTVSTEARQRIDGILQMEHVGSMRTVMTSGLVVDRGFSFEVVLETLSWVIVYFVYNGGRFNSAAMAITVCNFDVKMVLYGLLLSGSFLCVLRYCIHKTTVCLRKAWQRANFACWRDGNE